MTHRDDIDKFLFEEMQLMPGCCSSHAEAAYNIAREAIEKYQQHLLNGAGEISVGKK